MEFTQNYIKFNGDFAPISRKTSESRIPVHLLFFLLKLKLGENLWDHTQELLKGQLYTLRWYWYIVKAQNPTTAHTVTVLQMNSDPGEIQYT